MIDYEIERRANILNKIEKAKGRYILQKEETARAAYIEELIFADYIRLCKVYKNDYDYLQKIMSKAFTEDKRGANFKTMQSKIQGDFFNGNKEAKVDKIISEGYESYAFLYEVKYKNFIFNFYIPMLDNINVSNFHSTNEGKICLGIKDGCMTTIIATSYSVEEIKKTLDKFLEENIKQE